MSHNELLYRYTTNDVHGGGLPLRVDRRNVWLLLVDPCKVFLTVCAKWLPWIFKG